MTYKKFENLIEQGESTTIEFKQRFSTHEKIAKEIIAFANTKGGFILFGINDNGSIYGLESEKSDTELITECCEKYCEPPVKYNLENIEYKKKDILILYVNESNIKPHRIQDYNSKIDLNTAQVFIRVNDKSVPASKEMIKIMQTQTEEKSLTKYNVGKNEKIVFEMLQKKETITVKELSESANISQRRASRTLINLVRANFLFIHVKDNGAEFFTAAI
ncbi:MAG: ATP-binding protein [Ignavibacteriaceae bacterium]|jgi:predicted HTH transcriptional regulator|nr:ATP-binding protein [Ignavibacteriaceae bacterium]